MSISGFPAYDRLTATSAALRTRMTEETRQAMNGRRSETYAGLGEDARRAIDLRAEVGRRETLARAASRGEARASHTQVLLSRISEIATDLSGRATALLGMNPSDAKLIVQSARNSLRELGGLLNARYDGEAVFGGLDVDGQPIPGDIEASGMVKGIAAGLQGMTPGTGPAVRAAALDLAASDADGITPFSTHATDAATGLIPDARRAVPVEDGMSVDIGLFANRNATAVPSTSPDSTGSWARDLLGGLAVIANLDKASAANVDDFAEVVRGAVGMLRAGLDGVTAEAGALGGSQARLNAAGKQHREVADQLQQQLDSVEQVDLAAAITRLQATRTQLEASYRSIAMLGDLSLTRFLR
jgi:flagellin-like hook-associated protein FlgL